MDTKVNKTIKKFQIKSFEFYKAFSWSVKREVITGYIWLSDNKRVRIEGNEFYIVNKDHKLEDTLTGPDYKKVKRMISRYFSTYRKNGNCQHVGYWRSRAVDGLHNINLFRHSEISFKENKSTFIKLAA